MKTKARDFAIEAHGTQRYGDAPYVVHLDEVASNVMRVDPSDVAGTVAYLHDVLEDTDVSAAAIEERFGTFVRECVEIVTDPEGQDRKERKRLLHDRLASVSEAHFLALAVKAADRLANLRNSARDNPSLFAMYKSEHTAFREAAFRPGLCDALWADMDGLLYR